MGLWGAAQALAFGLGGLLGTSLSDIARFFMDSPGAAYGLVFAFEALLFLVAAQLGRGIAEPQAIAANELPHDAQCQDLSLASPSQRA